MTIEIIDLHSRSSDGLDILQQLRDGLTRPPGHKRIPTMLLYDERGLKLYDDLTAGAPEYYLFPAEEEILKNKADDIVRTMHRGAEISSDEVVVELGAGSLRKTSHVLLGLAHFVGEAKASSPITYYALDLERRELERTLDELETSELGEKLAGRVETKGMWGTYNDGLKFIREGGLLNGRFTDSFSTSIEPFRFSLRNTSLTSSGCKSTEVSGSLSSNSSTPEEIQPPLHILFLGSSLGNFSRKGAADFLRSLPLRPGSGDSLLLGLDHDNDKEKIEKAYNDSKGYTANFIFNGLRSAGRVLGNEKMFDEDKWEYVNRYDVAERSHEAFFKSKCVHTIHEPSHGQDITFLKGELMKIEESLKFSDRDSYTLFTKGNLRPVQRWTDKMSQYSLWLLERPPFSFPLLSTPFSYDAEQHYDLGPISVPSREDCTNIWNFWNFRKAHDPPFHAFLTQAYGFETHVSLLPGSHSYLFAHPCVKPPSGIEHRTDEIQSKL